MSAPPTSAPSHPSPAPDGPPPAVPIPATPGQLAWLDAQIEAWRAEGLLDDATAAAVRARYVAHRRVTLASIVLTLGALFVGVGLLWTVAANLDELSPLVRFVVVVALWVGLLVTAEVLATRRERLGDVASPVVGAVRLLVAAAFGAVVFQAAQSLQVAAYEPALLGVWALGALLYAYAVAGVGPAVVGIALGASWLVRHTADASNDVLSVTLAFATAALAAVSVGVLHLRLRARADAWRPLGVPWREVGGLLTLGALFGAALPFAQETRAGSPLLWVVLGLAVVLAAAAVVTGHRLDRLEVGLAALGLVLVVLLALWRPEADPSVASDLAPGDWVRAVVAVAVYLGVASGYAVLGGARDSDRLTWAATAALVLFTTTQAFAVFVPILSGAVLFLAVGVVLLGTGVLADRGRRRLLAEREEGAS
ncbi:DUF2157 domain-containing protein [Phycicoccus sonneratiae]|uniref:DUF2157 domain-containing protein n=1 Tax=Phycicoccus sonneratiae TaxID=2807628 RepID=A0ABS2CMF3_9MICO|nr:DUF2157 domain-containing protein [Phycicoccus sonneraticus]MBM6401041.1 DUF2157 domain-containing protein [Phycicoccus sonneraticus]